MPARVLRTALPIALFALFALPAHAFRLDFVQTGGTAVGGNGGAGDTLILDIVATVEAGEGSGGVFASPQWDLEGGNVLDLVGASQIPFQIVNGKVLHPINSVARLGTPLDGMTSSITLDINDPVYPAGAAGAEAFFGVQQIVGIGDSFAGAATFTVGTLVFMLNSSDTSDISFYATDELPGWYDTVIIDDQWNDIALVSELGTFRVNAQPVPEPGARVLFALALLTTAAHLRGRRFSRRKSEF